MKYWEIIADNLSKAGWSWGCVSTIDSRGRTIWIAGAHRDGKRLIVHAADPPHGCGVLCGAKVGNGVADGAGVAVAAEIGVVTCEVRASEERHQTNYNAHAEESDPQTYSHARGWT